MRRIMMGGAMTRIPSVVDGRLRGTVAGGVAGLAVGSAAWFAWLAALFGLLAGLRNLGVTLLLVERLAAGGRVNG